MKQYIKSFSTGFIRTLTLLGTLLLLVITFRWLGFKGFIGFLIGSLMMAYLILSKNWLLRFLIEKTRSLDFIDMIRQK